MYTHKLCVLMEVEKKGGLLIFYMYIFFSTLYSSIFSNLIVFDLNCTDHFHFERTLTSSQSPASPYPPTDLATLHSFVSATGF